MEKFLPRLPIISRFIIHFRLNYKFKWCDLGFKSSIRWGEWLTDIDEHSLPSVASQVLQLMDESAHAIQNAQVKYSNELRVYIQLHGGWGILNMMPRPSTRSHLPKGTHNRIHSANFLSIKLLVSRSIKDTNCSFYAPLSVRKGRIRMSFSGPCFLFFVGEVFYFDMFNI